MQKKHKRAHTCLRRSYNHTFLNGLLTSCVRAMTTGPILTAFALLLGAGNVAMGFLHAVSPIANLLHLPVAYFLEKGINAKKLAIWSSFLAQPFLFLAIISIFIPQKEIALFTFVLSYFLFHLIGSVTGGAFWPWMKELVSPRLMNRFFAHRIRYIMMVRVLCMALTTLLISQIQRFFPEFESLIYIVCFMIALISGILASFSLKYIEDKPLSCSFEKSFLTKIKKAFQNKGFLKLLTALCCVNFAMNFALSFFIVFILKELHYSVTLTLILTLIQQLADIMIIKSWSRASDKIGVFKVLAQSCLVYMIPTILFVLIALSMIPLWSIIPVLIFAYLIIGAANAGLNLGINDAAVSYVPKKMSSVYIAITNTCRFCFSALAPLTAGVLLDILQSQTPLHSWAFFFITATGVFLLTALFLFKIKQKPL